MNWRNIGLVFRREVLDQLRDRRTLFMIAVLPLLLYPALGIGMVQLTMHFSEQPRTVVLLGASALPDPPLLDGERFRVEWLRSPADAEKLQVLTDAGEPQGLEAAELERRARLLATAETLRDRLHERTVVLAQLREAEAARDVASAAKLKHRSERLTADLQEEFGVSGIQVLIVIPPTFSADLEQMKRDVTERRTAAADAVRPRPVILRNTADEKSLIASSRVQDILHAWERELLRRALKEMGLPEHLPTPVAPEDADLAGQQQLSANVWSKLFPAFLVLMTLTGAFYPAIDLGAGEKERGTMETLLISPATRSEIVLGKFFTVMAFSASTALLNLLSLGFTGKYTASLAGANAASRLGDLTLPPLSALLWVLIFMAPLSALFSALCLAFATFARSSKEGQYYLTPLLMVTLGLTVFCLSPMVEMHPFYSVLPVMGPALMLKGLLLNNHHSSELYLYAAPVLAASFGYSLVALWWAIDQFGSEEVLFREAERFEVRLWIRHLLRDKEPTPSFAEAGFCFVLIMLLQFAALNAMQTPLQNATPDERPQVMLRLLMIQQLVFVATPALLMGLMLTTSMKETFQLRLPRPGHLAAAVVLPFALHPLAVEFGRRMQWFFPPLPTGLEVQLAAMTSDRIPVWLVFAAFAVAPAVCEEIAFRGFLLSGFRHSGRNRLAITLSAFAFGMIHMIPQQVLNASLLGMVLGLVAVRSRSLAAPIAFHVLFNGLEICRGRFGSQLPTEGAWQWFFAHDAGVRYQPALLLLAGAVATGLIWFLMRNPSARTVVSGSAAEPFERGAAASHLPTPTNARPLV